jgi:hypothetical protein
MKSELENKFDLWVECIDKSQSWGWLWSLNPKILLFLEKIDKLRMNPTHKQLDMLPNMPNSQKDCLWKQFHCYNFVATDLKYIKKSGFYVMKQKVLKYL